MNAVQGAAALRAASVQPIGRQALQLHAYHAQQLAGPSQAPPSALLLRR
jgi:hypothetical protein